MTSRFWQSLADEHAANLDVHGFGVVKRVQALRYFTWRWSFRRTLGGEQGRYLITKSRIGSLLRAMLTPVKLSSSAWEPVKWTLIERWLFAVASRLVWDIALRRGAADVVALPEPQLGSPFPVRWRGRLISQDLANTALELASVDEALAGRPLSHVLEIGAGYGRTAYAVLARSPTVSYTIVDIQPAIDISRWYLTTLFPDRDIRFVDATDGIDAIEPFDLALSISSLQEMGHAEVDRYLKMFDRLGRPGSVVYVKQWKQWTNPVDQIEQRFDRYALPERWRPAFRRTAPVQTTFGEAAWVRDA